MAKAPKRKNPLQIGHHQGWRICRPKSARQAPNSQDEGGGGHTVGGFRNRSLETLQDYTPGHGRNINPGEAGESHQLANPLHIGTSNARFCDPDGICGSPRARFPCGESPRVLAPCTTIQCRTVRTQGWCTIGTGGVNQLRIRRIRVWVPVERQFDPVLRVRRSVRVFLIAVWR